jgi:hypothetical protein
MTGGRPTAAELVADAERLVGMIEDELSRATDPTLRDVLETQRDEALEWQAQVAARAASEAEEARQREAVKRLPPSPAQLEALWRDYRELRILGRSRMSPRTKSRALRRFGRQLYEALPW